MCNAMLVKLPLACLYSPRPFSIDPLSYDTLEYVVSFSSDQCPEGVVAVAGDALRIFTIEPLGETFNETAISLTNTPRQFVFQPKQQLLVIIESDQGAFTAEEREAAKKECFEGAGMGENGSANAEQMENGGDDEYQDDPILMNSLAFLRQSLRSGFLASESLTPRTVATTCLLELQDNAAAFSVCTVNFHGKEHRTLLAVGTAEGLHCWPENSLVA